MHFTKNLLKSIPHLMSNRAGSVEEKTEKPKEYPNHVFHVNDLYYLINEYERNLLKPYRDANRILISFLNNFSDSQYPQIRKLRAFSHIFETSSLHHREPKFNIPSTERSDGKYSIKETCVLDIDFCRLVNFVATPLDGQTKPVSLPKLLIVAPLSGHFATLLRGTVVSLLPHFDVTISCWKNVRSVPKSKGDFDLSSYVNYIIRFCHHMQESVHVMGVCQPAVPLLAATSIMSETKDPFIPKSNILIAGPIDTRVNPTAVNKLALSHDLDWFSDNFISTVPMNFTGAMRRVYPGYLQLFNFMAMNPKNHLSAHRQMFNALCFGDEQSAYKRRSFYREYKTVMDLTESFFLQTTSKVFQRHLLPKGQLTVDGEKINLNAVDKTNFLCIEGELDDICGIGQTKAALGLLKSLPNSRKNYLLAKGVGHYGAFNGSKFTNKIVPEIVSFVDKTEKESTSASAVSRKKGKVIKLPQK